jgi:hypothetical protein
MRRSLALLAFIALALPGCVDTSFGGDAVHQTLHEAFATTPTAHIRVRNVAGFIRIVPWARREIDVVARKRGSTIAAVRRTSVVITHDGTPATEVDISTQYPHGSLLFWGDSASVDYTIHVPRQARLDVADVSGDVTANGVAGDLNVSNVSGDVTAMRSGGNLRIQTVSGSINASMLHVGSDNTASMGTVSGEIDLAVPANSSADVRAESISGDFSSDFNVPRRHRTVGVQADGTIGGGAGSIDLRTISGSITLSKS